MTCWEKIINIKKLFNAYNITYRESGTGVTKGWINIDCPFCAQGDSEQHLGFNPKGGYFSCWRCGGHSAISTLSKKLRIPPKRAKLLLKQYNIHTKGEKSQNQDYGRVDFDFEINNKVNYDKVGGCLKNIHAKYLLNERGLDPGFLVENYGVRGTIADYPPNCIIFPVFYKGVEVAWVGRKMDDSAYIRYVNCMNEKQKVPMKKILYGADSVKDTVVVTEGIIDAISVGPGAVAVLGVNYAKEQIEALKQYSNVFIWFDSDAPGIKKANELQRSLSPKQNIKIIKSEFDANKTLREYPRAFNDFVKKLNLR